MLFFVGEAPGALLRPPGRAFTAVLESRCLPAAPGVDGTAVRVECPRRGIISGSLCEDCPHLVGRIGTGLRCAVSGVEPVWTWMTPAWRLVVTTPATPCAVADRVAAEAGVHRLPVLDGARALVGMVCRCDLGRDPAARVGDVMARDVFATGPATPLASALAAFDQLGVGALPVVDDGIFLGMVTRADLHRAGAP
jgi:hypothetical protein